MSGGDVRTLQRDLGVVGYSTPATGYFGSVTTGNVKRFERHYRLRADGVVTRSVAKDVTLAVAVTRAQRASQTGTASTHATTADVRGSGGAGVGEPSFGPAGSPSSAPTGKGHLNSDGTATPPAGAPAVIQKIFAAANVIAKKPYIYGGGHGSWNDSGYDCSGSVSYALHGGGLLSSPEDSTDLESYGSGGAGRWITIYANAGHTFMYIAGLRFDTAAQSSTGGSRWTSQTRSTSGYVVRHPTGW